jgi:HD-GYP domain-containing protein (c-di-GMP phosphodiesterase class II)
MLQRPDYSILDPLTEICEVVGYNLCYLYVNDAAMEWEDTYKDQLIGRPVLEFHPEIESTHFFRHLQECLVERKSIEFEDELFPSGSAGTKWKIRIDPVREGVLIHAVRLSPARTKVRVSRPAASAGITGNPARQPMNPWPAYKSPAGDPARDLQIEGWLDELDVRTHETNEHIHHVAEGTVALAKMAGLSESEIVQVRRGALLHDIGKIGVPEAILMKPGRLTAEEWQVVRKHPVFAYELFYPIEYLRDCLAIPYSHHEKWDGTGYPLGLKGEQIPLPARLFAVVEVWDKLSCDRVHGHAWPQEKITQYIQEQSGSHFDPQVVDLFFQSQKQSARLAS